VSSHSVQTRWEDLDALGHVGHTAVLVLLEQGRDAFLAEHGIARNQYVVGRCSVTFNREIDSSQDAVTVEAAVRELGTSSVTTAERILSPSGDVAVEAEFGLVLWDAEGRGSRPITETERTSLESAREEGAPA
jgi:acyl-CoA thioesterase FadM